MTGLIMTKSSAIIKRIISLRDARQASLAYFYFDFRDKDKKQDFRNFITSLLVQLSASLKPVLQDNLRYLFYTWEGCATTQHWCLEDLSSGNAPSRRKAADLYHC
jgi:hypothetical protein